MRSYELLILIHSRLDEGAAKEETQKVADLLKSNGGEITKTDVWGRRKIAYPIKKQLEATYVLFKVDLEPASLKDLEFTLKLDEDIIRYMLVIDLDEAEEEEEVAEEEAIEAVAEPVVEAEVKEESPAEEATEPAVTAETAETVA